MPLSPHRAARCVVALALPVLIAACSDDNAPDRGALKGTIAFVCPYEDGANDELCLMNPDGTAVRRLTNNPGPDLAPAWHSDGGSLAFNSRRPPHEVQPQIYRYTIETGQVLRITDGEAEDHRPSWVPGLDEVVFQRGDFANGFELFRQSIPPGPAEQLTSNSGRINAAGSYSPDGTRLLLQSNRDASGIFPFATYIVDADTGSATRIAQTISESHDGPRWSPDGTRIVLSAGGNLYVVTLATGTITTVTDDETFADSAPDWSPDGTRLVFQSDRVDPELASIHVIDLSSGEITLLGMGRTPVWTDREF